MTAVGYISLVLSGYTNTQPIWQNIYCLHQFDINNQHGKVQELFDQKSWSSNATIYCKWSKKGKVLEKIRYNIIANPD